jgi:hypothetical protein
MKWILCKDELPPINVDVLIYEGQKTKTIIGNNKELKIYKVGEYCVGYYSGEHTRKVWVKPPYEETREEIETYNEWIYNKGMSISDENPIAWSYIDEFKEN